MERRHRWAAALAVAIVWITPAAAGATDVSWRGLLDLMLTEHSPAFESNQLTHGDDPFDPYRLRLFTDARVNADAVPANASAATAATTPTLNTVRSI